MGLNLDFEFRLRLVKKYSLQFRITKAEPKLDILFYN